MDTKVKKEAGSRYHSHMDAITQNRVRRLTASITTKLTNVLTNLTAVTVYELLKFEPTG
jgi:hypothetical protein